ncbi:MAG: flagellar basal-body MS-ring/collar protein FliF [Methylococcales bacterium]|nr:flagellar basal-body MS-ring/collar protein FliF [Methylococcales bacterium]
MSEQNSNNLVPTTGIQQALVATSDVHPAMKGLSELTMGRQLGLMLGLALSVAIGIAIVLWSQVPSYGRLFSEIGENDVSEVIAALNTQGVKYKVESGSGAIMVPTDQVNEVKLKLAGLGLPKSNSLGYELLDKDPGFGSSKSVEMVRFQRALEGEIAQTIMSIQNVKTARVLLAIPAQSVFVRDRKKPSASVIVSLYQGRTLDKGQIESIIHLVASSVPQLEAEQVTVVDQKGRLLNSNDSSSTSYLTSKQFEYKKNVEEHLMERIGNILSPLVGDGMRVQVSADVDFTETDKTQEMFNPQSSVLRSEQTSEEKNASAAIQGVPGALSNQPTPAGAAPDPSATANTANSPSTSNTASTGDTGSSSKNATRNFELDKTITRTRLATGVLRRLSVAVVVDDQHTIQEDGKVIPKPYTPEDINRFSDLVKQAVGFDSTRGDQVTVNNVAFKIPDALEALPEVPMWKQGWFFDVIKQVGAGLAVILLIFFVLRPVMRSLAGSTIVEKEVQSLKEQQAMIASGGHVNGHDPLSLPEATPVPGLARQGSEALPIHMDDLLLIDVPHSYEARLEYLQRVVDNDPKLVAQVIKRWVR